MPSNERLVLGERGVAGSTSPSLRGARAIGMREVLAVAASLAFAGCAGGAPASAESEAIACAADAWCGSDATCVRGLCVRACDADPTSCGAGQTCVDGACVVLDASDVPGCESDLDCPSSAGACLASRCADLPVAIDCGPTRPCPSGSVCAGGVCAAEPCDPSDPSTFADPSDPTTACAPRPRPCDPSDPSTWGDPSRPGCTTGTPSDPSTGTPSSPSDPA